ncbi:retrovirus-related pol polyprotein from transposon TNT 1-94 [Tanacetum coccineum]
MNPKGCATNNGYVILCLCVDDMLIVGSNDKMIQSTKDMLKSRFDMKDMGLADVILGVKITRTQNGLVLSQTHFVDKILEKYNPYDSNIARNPIDTTKYLSKNKGQGVNQARYSSIIGSLISTSGYVFTLGGGAISWKSSKQTVISRSTMESEFIALDKCAEEAECLHQFIEDIPRWPMPVKVICIHYDSQSAIGRAHSIMYNGVPYALMPKVQKAVWSDLRNSESSFSGGRPSA